jgi:hypothetical protein
MKKLKPETKQLLHLPVEIFERITRHLTDSVGVINAWDYRPVCREYFSGPRLSWDTNSAIETFQQFIEYEVFAKQPETAFTGRPRGKTSRHLLRKNMAPFLEYRMRSLNGARGLLPNYARSMVEELMTATGRSSTDYETRNLYAAQIARTIADNYKDAFAALTAKPTRRIYHWTKYILEGSVENVDKVAAAAAIGNVSAVRTYLEDRDYDPYLDSEVFGNPLVIAASLGRLEMVRALSKIFVDDTEEDVEKYPSAYRESIQVTPFHRAVNAALEGKHYNVASFCLKILSRYETARHMHEFFDWIEMAIRAGNVDLAEDVLRVRPKMAADCYSHGFSYACEKKQWDIARLFIDLGLLHVDQEFQYRSPGGKLHMIMIGATDCPLTMAILNGGLELVSHLLHLGADPDGLNDLYNKPLYLAQRLGRELMEDLLTEHGADTAYDFVECEQHMRKYTRVPLCGMPILPTSPIYRIVDVDTLFSDTPTELELRGE